MEAQISSKEIIDMREILEDYQPAQYALDNLARHNGNVERSFEDLWIEKNGKTLMSEGKSIWKVTLNVLRQELCGDDGFRGQLKEYTKNPGSSPLLSGLIVSLVGLATTNGLPIDPAIATVIVLYILKIGLNIFCDYTEPPAEKVGTLPPGD
ncbi:hypothetical protein [Anabaena sp. CCY 0017]|uniref:hypothetical protein n=1 Tax=Anabaena sp. CCY 0017 TaxID=3103866 RepID=UPI0039C6C6C9